MENRSEICTCKNPVSVLSGNNYIYCSRCGGRILARSFQTAESIPLDELHEIRDAKENIRNTLNLQKKRKKERAGELDFLLKRL